MKKRILKLIAFAALIAVMFAGITACEDEVVHTSSDETEAVDEHVAVADDGVVLPKPYRNSYYALIINTQPSLYTPVAYDYQAWIPNTYLDNYGYSVRYVFEPQYR